MLRQECVNAIASGISRQTRLPSRAGQTRRRRQASRFYVRSQYRDEKSEQLIPAKDVLALK